MHRIKKRLLFKALDLICSHNPGLLQEWAEQKICSDHTQQNITIESDIPEIGCQCPHCKYQRKIEDDWVNNYIIN